MRPSQSFGESRHDERHFRSLAQVSRLRDRHRLRSQWSTDAPWAWRSTRELPRDDDVTRARTKLKSSSMTRLLSLDTPITPVAPFASVTSAGMLSHLEDPDRYDSHDEVERSLRNYKRSLLEQKARRDATRASHLHSASMSCIDSGRMKSRKRENYVRTILGYCSVHLYATDFCL